MKRIRKLHEKSTGRYYVIEGIDGSGKTTQAGLVVARLQELGREVLAVREPGSTPLADAIRDILLKNRGVHLVRTAEALLFFAARAQLREEIILPALAGGIDVVSDRSYISTLAYQTVEKGENGLTMREVRQLAKVSMRDLVEPDEAVLLDLSYEQAFFREDAVPDKIESRGKEYFDETRNKYKKVARRMGFAVVNAAQSIEDVKRDVFEALKIAA